MKIIFEKWYKGNVLENWTTIFNNEENQQLKSQLEASEKARKEAIEYIKSNANIYLNICGDKIGFLKENDGKAPIELLDILDIDKGGENEK